MATRDTPLRRGEVIATALEMIDEGGLAQLSLRRLGARVGVQGMSLYHLFKDKAEILDGVAKLILRELTVPDERPADVVQWSLDNARRYRSALLAHPNAIPLFLDRHPARGRASMYEEEFAALGSLGVEDRYWLVIVETLESYILGTSLFLHPNNRLADTLADDTGGELVKRALNTRPVDDELAFSTGYVALLERLLEAYAPGALEQRRAAPHRNGAHS
jgi:AcrR family transcriptional regulator